MKKTTNNFTALVMEKKEILDILQTLMERLDDIEKESLLEWRKTGEQEQMTRWNDNENRSMPVYLDDEGNRTFEITEKPLMTDCYDNLPKLELDERDNARMAAIEKIRKTLASLA